MILLDNIQNNIQPQPNYWPQICIGVLIVVIGGIIVAVIKRFIAKWDEANKERDEHLKKMDRNIQLLNIKSDCTISGLKQMNGGTSEKFTSVFDKSFAERTRDIDWINNN